MEKSFFSWKHELKHNRKQINFAYHILWHIELDCNQKYDFYPIKISLHLYIGQFFKKLRSFNIHLNIQWNSLSLFSGNIQ